MDETSSRGGRSRVVVLAWTQRAARQRELAAALGGTAVVFSRPARIPSVLVPVRYVAHAIGTVVTLWRRRPEAVIVTSPPVPAAAAAALACRMLGIRLLIDSHPAGFGAQGDRVSARLQVLQRWAIRRSQAVLVTSEAWRATVEALGSRAVVVHEPTTDDAAPAVAAAGHPGARPSVLFVCIFAPDEPYLEVISAARSLPGVDIVITGDPDKAVGIDRSALPRNVSLSGYLRGPDYQAALRRSDIVLALTTEPTSVMRAGYEAVQAERPLIVSDYPDVVDAFPFAVPTANDADAIADAIRAAVENLHDLRASAPAARLQHRARWQDQLESLRSAVAVGSPSRMSGAPHR